MTRYVESGDPIYQYYYQKMSGKLVMVTYVQPIVQYLEQKFIDGNLFCIIDGNVTVSAFTWVKKIL